MSDESLVTQFTGLTTQQQLYIQWIVMIAGVIGKLYGSAVNGGGLKAIFTRAWLGNTVPKVMAQDYKEELAAKPTPPNP